MTILPADERAKLRELAERYGFDSVLDELASIARDRIDYASASSVTDGERIARACERAANAAWKSV